MSSASIGRAFHMSAVELIGLVGFSFLVAWMFLCFFWLFCEFPPHVPIEIRDASQFAVFAGMAVGYAVLAFLGRIQRFNVFSGIVVAAEVVCSVLLPLVAFSMHSGMHIPLWAVCIANALAGIAGAALTLSWLDVLSRIGTDLYGRFTGFGFVGGALLFAFATASPAATQSIFGLAYALFSIVLLLFSTQNASANAQAAPLESTESTWTFTKEIEPSFFVFGIVFALNFLFLFNSGRDEVLVGMLSVVPGALVVAIIGFRKNRLGITVVQRIVVMAGVIMCVVVPVAPPLVQLVCSALMCGVWGAFKTVNYAFVVKKCVAGRTAPLFRQAPMRLLVTTLGFAVGWGMAAAVTVAWGAHAEAFATMRLIMAIALVCVMMVFFPIGRHHLSDGTADDGTAQNVTVSVQMDESEAFCRRCTEIAKLYQLSPRESDILEYLARGRNASWIQEELTISPHTVKSHIYNIYRKMDIHSQQKLMSFVEEFPLGDDSARNA